MSLWIFKLFLVATIVSVVAGQLTNECDTPCSGPNDVCRICATACPPTCDQPNQDGMACTQVCRDNTCVCTNGTVRSRDGTCVAPSDCPSD